ncbi:hypothetical protein B296_00024095 [Ensete ventricosum]|uniref:Uncharacterized protein n=1 Tax=Ensete ventricosum TaxID=4639 RepID=A0A426Y7U0_ENSVE|nr:hypothetical protein B296_00024095 [Ensete ventricosum]
MGNCQASEAATAVIQHPGGRVERLYWPTSAADVMKSNPGYYVALVTLYVSEEKQDGSGGTVRITRVRLLKPKDMLLLGQVYRLITSQGSSPVPVCTSVDNPFTRMIERDKKQREFSRIKQLTLSLLFGVPATIQPLTKQERDRPKSSTQTATRGRHWRPSLGSISEVGS